MPLGPYMFGAIVGVAICCCFGKRKARKHRQNYEDATPVDPRDPLLTMWYYRRCVLN